MMNNELLDSFKSNFEEDESQMTIFKPWFEKIANKILSWDLQNAFVDVSQKKNFIDFNLYFKDGFYISIAKDLNDDSNEVFFIIARNHRTLIIDTMDLDEFVSTCSKFWNEVKNVL